SDGVLRAMGRNSTVFQYREIMEYFSRAAPQAALGADVIVGFPGESDDDFRATEDFLAASPLAYVHVFSYSPRPGTAASSRPPVDERTKRARAVRLRGLSREKNLEFRKRFSGAALDGVAIRVGGEGVEVLTPNYIAVRAPFGAVRKGDRVRVKITKVQERETLGEIIPNKKCHPERSEGSRPTPRVPSQGSGRLKESPERSEGSPPT
ncbi:MAG: hypothetical protein Q8O91_02585, partial [Candidatus Aminicenantes bacterium]|nr:hypothetical protein [Candidatus Aminicenantes bacterium]